MMNMGQIYIDLIKTGNVLFKNWTATIYCDPDNKYTIRVNFGMKCENQNIFGLREREGTTINSLNKTIKFLQNSHQEWLAHINEKRDQFPCLNFFQIDQVVMLRTQMAELIRKSQNNNQQKLLRSDFKSLFDLLFNINSTASLELIGQANEYVFTGSQKNFVENVAKVKTDDSENGATTSEVKSDFEKKRQDLMDLGFAKYFEFFLSSVYCRYSLNGPDSMIHVSLY